MPQKKNYPITTHYSAPCSDFTLSRTYGMGAHFWCYYYMAHTYITEKPGILIIEMNSACT